MTFLIFIYSDSIADTSRGLFIGKELTKLNHKVKFAGGENEYKNLITKEGYYYYSLPEMPLELARKLSKEGVVFTYKILTEFVKSELEILEKESPDVCISSFRLSSYVSTRIAKIPLISIGYYYWYKEFYSTIKPFIYNKKYFPKSCKDNPQNIDQLGFNAYVFARLLKSNGFKEFTTFDRILRTDLNIILDLPGLFPRLENCDWPSDIYIAGPFIWEPSFNNHDEIEYEIIKFKKDQKLIAISFGSTGNKRDLEIILKNRLPNQYKIIVYGRNVSKIQNEKNSENCKFIDMIPGSILAKHTDIIICHGGIGTIYQYLENGVPIIGIPWDYEQYFNITGCVENGVGILVENNIMKKNIEIILKSMLFKSSYQNNAKRISCEFKTYHNPFKNVSELIHLRYLNNKAD